MEIIIYMLILLILEKDFYNNINTIYNPTTYDFLINKNNKLTKDYIPNDLELINIKYACKDKYLRKRGNFEHVISSCQSYTTSFMFTSEIKPSRI